MKNYICFNHSRQWRLLGLVAVAISTALYFFGGIIFRGGKNRTAAVVLFTAGIGLILMKNKTQVNIAGQNVLWQIGFVFLWINYRRILFMQIKSFIVRYKGVEFGPMTSGNNNRFHVSPAEWQLVLRLKTDGEYVMTSYKEEEKSDAEECARKLTSVVAKQSGK